jgi:hypothetical protein
MSSASRIGEGNNIRPLAKDFSVKLMRRLGSAGKNIASLNVHEHVIKLKMECVNTTDEDLRRIIAKFRSYKCLDRVQELGLDGSHITGNGIPLLADFSNLKELRLSCNLKIAGEEFKNLRFLKSLERLELTWNPQLGRVGVGAIKFVKELPVLKHLNIKLAGVVELKEWEAFRGGLLENNPSLEIIV